MNHGSFKALHLLQELAVTGGHVKLSVTCLWQQCSNWRGKCQTRVVSREFFTRYSECNLSAAMSVFILGRKLERVESSLHSGLIRGLITWSHVTGHPSLFCVLALITAAGKTKFPPYLRLQSPCKGHRHLACKGASVPLLFFVQFYPKTTPNFGQQRQKHHRFSFVGFSMALWKFAPCLCKNWSKTFFLLSECPFFPLQCLIQNFIEQ